MGLEPLRNFIEIRVSEREYYSILFRISIFQIFKVVLQFFSIKVKSYDAE